MAFRSLTDEFLLLRKPVIHSRWNFQEHNDQIDSVTSSRSECIPTVWIMQLKHAQGQLSELCKKIEDLNSLQTKNLYRPSLDDNSSEERDIESLRREITLILGSIHKVIQLIKDQQNLGSNRERRLKQNVIRTLALALQEHTVKFRSSQSSYLNEIKFREQRLSFFDTPTVNYNNNTTVEKTSVAVKKIQNVRNKNFFDDDTDDIDKDFMMAVNKPGRDSIASSSNLDNMGSHSNVFYPVQPTPNTSSAGMILNKMRNFPKDECKIN